MIAVLPADVADHVADLGDLLRRALLVEDRQLGADLRGELLVQLHAAGVRRDDDEVGEAEVVEVLREHHDRGHVVDRDAEEALDLAGVEVHRHDAVRAGGLEHVGDEARADRLARRRLLVLAAVAEPRAVTAMTRCADAPTAASIIIEQLHQRVVRVDPGRRVAARRLDEEDVGAADRLLVAAVDLAVRERLERDRARDRRRACRRSARPAPGSRARRTASAACRSRWGGSWPSPDGSGRSSTPPSVRRAHDGWESLRSRRRAA